MPHVTMKEMLTAGMHFGHQTRRWNPKMKPYIFGARNKIYIINLDKTLPLFNRACDFIVDNVAKGGNVLFIGTKEQAQDIIRDEANRCSAHYVNKRWLGGMLTNFQTIKKSVEHLKFIEGMKEDGTISRYKKKEILGFERELEKLDKNLGGLKEMRRLPSAIFIIDTKRERIAVEEANRLGIPVVAVVDTNCDPDGVNYPIPANDDAIRSIKLITSRIADAVLEGKSRRPETGEPQTEVEMEAAMTEAGKYFADEEEAGDAA